MKNDNEKKPIKHVWFGGYGRHQHPVVYFRTKGHKTNEFFYRTDANDAKEIIDHIESLVKAGYDVRVVDFEDIRGK